MWQFTECSGVYLLCDQHGALIARCYEFGRKVKAAVQLSNDDRLAIAEFKEVLGWN